MASAAPARFTSAPPSTASTAPTVRIRSVPPSRPVASGWSMPTSPTSMTVSTWAPRSSCGRSRNCNRGGHLPSRLIPPDIGEKQMMRTFRGGLLIGLAVAVAVAAGAITYERYDTRTLKRTIRRGEVLCGVNTGLPGFSVPDDKGNGTGFDVDFCRALAAAIFDDPKKTKFIPLGANERFKELQRRKVDILSRNSTWSMSRETSYDLYFPAVAYYDGAGFMIPKSRNIDSALALDGSKVCVQDATTTKLNLADYFKANN